MQVVYCTTPANVFHVLRRQIHREFRKPLIFFFSKSLLRHPLARSKLADFQGDSSFFRRVLGDTAHEQDEFKIKPKEEIKRLILCSGQVWASLHKQRQDQQVDGLIPLSPCTYLSLSPHSFFVYLYCLRGSDFGIDVAITRIEQFHPFPFVSLKKNIESYPNLESVVWAQEEHLNAGGWTYVQPRLHVVLKETKYANLEVTYAGRGPSARYSDSPPLRLMRCRIFTYCVLVSRLATSISISTRKRNC
jgi:2-oxoglutarate dehydrogenase E1 component